MEGIEEAMTMSSFEDTAACGPDVCGFAISDAQHAFRGLIFACLHAACALLRAGDLAAVAKVAEAELSAARRDRSVEYLPRQRTSCGSSTSSSASSSSSNILDGHVEANASALVGAITSIWLAIGNAEQNVLWLHVR